MKKTSENLLNSFVDYLKLHNRSFKNHRSGVKHFLTYCDREDIDPLRLSIVQAQEFQQYLATLTQEDGTPRYGSAGISTLVSRVTSFYSYLKKHKHLHTNPFQLIEKVRRTKRLPRHILTEKEMDEFLSHLRNFMAGKTLVEKRQLYRAHVLAEFLYSTGARINEAASLTFADIDYMRGTVRLKDDKTGKQREGIVGSYLEKILRIYTEHMKPFVSTDKTRKDLVFGASKSLVVWFNNIANREAGKLGLGRLPSHSFRHAVGFHLLRGGCDIRYIQEILGHEELSTTQIYTKVDKEDLKCVLDSFHPRSHFGENHEEV